MMRQRLLMLLLKDGFSARVSIRALRVLALMVLSLAQAGMSPHSARFDAVGLADDGCLRMGEGVEIARDELDVFPTIGFDVEVFGDFLF